MKPEINVRAGHQQPLVFVDPTDDGPEVDILRRGKVIVRRGDDFILARPLPPLTVRDRRYAYPY